MNDWRWKLHFWWNDLGLLTRLRFAVVMLILGWVLIAEAIDALVGGR